MSSSAKSPRGPQVISPSADRLDIPTRCRSAADVKDFVESTLGIPASLQRLYRNGVELDSGEAIEGEDLDLVLALGSAYTIGRRDLTEVIDTLTGEPLHPPRSEADRRDPEVLSRGVRTRSPRELQGSERLEHAAEASREFREAWLQSRPRRLVILKALAARLPGQTIVTSVLNEGFTPMLRNWAASCDRHGIDPRSKTLLFPTDEGANAVAVELGFATYFDPDSLRGVPRTSAADYGDHDFRATVMCKPAIVADTLELGRNVLFQDMDMIWFADPTDELDRLASHDALDGLFMNDGPNGRFVPRHYNSGFFFLRSNQMTRGVWRSMMRTWHAIHMMRSDQMLLNQTIPHFEARGLRTAALEDQRFVNGHILVRNERRGLPMPTDPAVVHVSWTGHLAEKIDKMKRLGYWYLDESDE